MSVKPPLEGIDFSNPALYNAAYIPTFKNQSEFLHYFGSAGSGKSRFVAQKEIVKSFQLARKGRKTLIVRKVFNTLKESVYSELKTVIYQWKIDDCFDILKTPLQITNKLTGVAFLFIGLDDVERVKSISGVDRIWIEEATELAQRSELDQLRLRLRGVESVQVTLTYNPINVHHWLNTEFHEKTDPRHFIFKTTYRDNEKMLAVDPHYANYIEGLKETNPNYYKVYGLGEWGQNSEGLVYPDYTTVDEMPDVQFYGLDFGYNDPTALTEHCTADNFKSDRKDLFCNEVIYATGLTSAMLIERMDAAKVSKRLPIIADSARPEMIEDIRKAGYNVRSCTKCEGSVVDGINRVKTFNIRIKTGSKNILREIQNYSWLEKDGRFRDDEPKDAINHAMDAMRYGTETLNVTPFEVKVFRF